MKKGLTIAGVQTHPPDSTRFPALREIGVKTTCKTQTSAKLNPTSRDCGKDGKENQNRRQTTTLSLCTREETLSSTEFKSFRERQNGFKHSPRPPSVTRAQSAKSLQRTQGTTLTSTLRNLSSKSLSTPALHLEVNRSSGPQRGGRQTGCITRNYEVLADAESGYGGTDVQDSFRGVFPAVGQQIPVITRDQEPQGFDGNSPQFVRFKRPSKQNMLSISYHPETTSQRKAAGDNWCMCVIDEGANSEYTGVDGKEGILVGSIETRKGSKESCAVEKNVTSNERRQKEEMKLHQVDCRVAGDRAHDHAPEEDAGNQGSLAPKPPTSLPKRKLSPRVARNPLYQRSVKTQKSLRAKEEAERMDQSREGNNGEYFALDGEKTAMINSWLLDVSLKTAEFKGTMTREV